MVRKTSDSYFKKSGSHNVEDRTNTKSSKHIVGTSTDNHSLKIPRVESKEFDTSFLTRDPGLRPIGDYLASQHDEIRQACLKFGPYQPKC